MTLKIVLCGDGSVGKTALRVRYMGLGFMPTYLMTIGADFSMRNVTIATGEYAGKKTLCQIWDLAGQQSFSGVRALYYHGAHGALLVYDCTRPSTFESILGWTNEIVKNVRRPIPMVLLSNKSDLRQMSDFTISFEQGSELANLISKNYLNNQFSVPYIETSAKTGENVENAFGSLVEMIVNELLATQGS